MPRGLVLEAFFSLLDHAILNPEDAVCDARANPPGSTLDSSDFGFGRSGALVFLGLLTLIFFALFFFTVAFFRDPDRPVPADPNLIVAPADGRVSDIVELDEREVLKTKTRRVGIFLSIFDVHTNRAPIAGRIVYRQHHEGLCLDARHPDCPEKNEAMTWAFENPRGTIVVRQLTGAIARRIVAWANVGDELKKGERFGMIRFGS